jgi:hypothetical protein
MREMRQWGLSLVALFCLTTEGVLARPKIQDLLFKGAYQLQEEPLTNEKVWLFDPNQKNPHRQRWVVKKRSELSELKAKKGQDGKYRVSADGILAVALGTVRGPGPWYHPDSSFSCQSEPDSWFETQEGAKRAVAKAGQLWLDMLKEHRIQLSLQLEKVVTTTESAALTESALIFRGWEDSIDQKWRASAPEIARNEEWQFYLEEAKASGKCEKGKTVKTPAGPVRSEWKNRMEPPGGVIPDATMLLARAPARLWDGLFSVRLSIRIAGQLLNGRFLIDSGVPQSVFSQAWLENQGVFRALVEIPKAAPRSISGTDVWGGATHWGRRATVDQVELSGMNIPMTEFLIMETDFFGPPEFVGSCCDGVLGNDFLSQFVVEFSWGPPAEVRIWPRRNFQWPLEEYQWVEVSQDSQGDLISSCDLAPQEQRKENSSVRRLPNVRWNTGSSEGVEIHLPWQGELKKARASHLSDLWKIQCDAVSFAENIKILNPDPSETQGEGPFNRKSAAVDLGMSLLGSSGKFTLDLPNGRIWFPKPLPFKKERPTNQSGLHVDFSMVPEVGRVLRVTKIEKNSSAEALLKAGLKPGMVITQVDSQPSEDLDLWQVEQRLAGIYGKVVTLQWKVKNELKMAPLQVQK